MLEVVDLRYGYQKNPIGVGGQTPRISWKLSSDRRSVMQQDYEIIVSADPEGEEVIWQSGKITSTQSIHVEIPTLQLSSRTRYYYRVRCSDQTGETSPWSEVAYWETGLLDIDQWHHAQWIAAPSAITDANDEQVPYFRHEFQATQDIHQARLYVTALGLYEVELNGNRVGDSYFTPGWTSYRKRLQVQTYDVTDLVQTGCNAIGALVGKGWYSGNLAWENQRNIFGDRNALLLQLHIQYTDGSEECVVSNEKWRASGSPILMSEIYHGETYDARLEQKDWSKVNFDPHATWHSVQVIDHPFDILVPQENEPVRKQENIRPIELIRTPKGETVLDFGQNMVGWVRFSVQGEAGRKVQLHHAEVLDKEGNFYTANMRGAKVTNTYVLKGGEIETYEPRFTFQGFRYIKLINFPEPVRLENFTGVVLHSDMPLTGTFQCSDAMINQLQHNIEWGLKGNFLDVPTDCPQRDERLGWTGDAQMFIRTAAYLRGVGPFFTKWLHDLAADQRSDGGVPHVIPHVLNDTPHSSSAWGDAAVICPWTLYECYGDKRILAEQYESMKAWITYIRAQGDHEYLWNTGFHFGDWLGLDSKPDSYIGATDRDFIATAFYAYSTSLMQRTAEILGKDEDAQEFQQLYTHIVEAFTNEFITPAGRMSVSTQTAQVLALMFGLVQDHAKDRAVSKLLELLEESDFHLTTGFVGTPYLNHVLSKHGHTDIAYRLLFQQDYPSWLYQITKGATTIWEHWDGIKEDGSFWSADMNSFNHYAYGSIGDWLYRVVVGIDTDQDQVGYKHIHIRPQPPKDRLTWAEGQLETMYGTVKSKWTKSSSNDQKMKLEVTIPVNTTAEILLPYAEMEKVTESGTLLMATTTNSGIQDVKQLDHSVRVVVGSGDYAFSW